MPSRPNRWLMLPPAIAALALVAAACGGGSSTSAPAKNAAAAGSTASGPTVATTKTSLGTILVDNQGRTLYLFEKDQGSKSACDGGCAQAWPPFTSTGATQAGSGVSAALIGSTTRSDGKTQVTYNGHPLYYYIGDSGSGQTNGQGLEQFGAEWYVLSGQGMKVEKGEKGES